MKKFKLLTVAVAAAIAVQVGAMCLFAGCKGGNGEEKPSLTFEIADVTAWIDYPASEISPVFNLEGEHTVTYTTNSDKIRIDGNKVTALAEGEAIVFAEAKMPQIKGIVFFGVLAGIFSLASSGLCGWGLTGGLLAAFAGVAVLFFAVEGYLRRDKTEDA